jgi:hypothetical protein
MMQVFLVPKACLVLSSSWWMSSIQYIATRIRRKCTIIVCVQQYHCTCTALITVCVQQALYVYSYHCMCTAITVCVQQSLYVYSNHCMCTASTEYVKVVLFWRCFYHLPFCVCDFAFWCGFCFECWHRRLGKIVGVKQIDMSPDITILYNVHYFISFHCTPYHNTSHHIPQRTMPYLVDIISHHTIPKPISKPSTPYHIIP